MQLLFETFRCYLILQSNSINGNETIPTNSDFIPIWHYLPKYLFLYKKKIFI